MKTLLTWLALTLACIAVFFSGRVVYGQSLADITPPDTIPLASTNWSDPLDDSAVALPTEPQPVTVIVTVYDYTFQNPNVKLVLGACFDGQPWMPIDTNTPAPVVVFTVTSDNQWTLFRAGNQIL